jgi:hypothetical protein
MGGKVSKKVNSYVLTVLLSFVSMLAVVLSLYAGSAAAATGFLSNGICFDTIEAASDDFYSRKSSPSLTWLDSSGLKNTTNYFMYISGVWYASRTTAGVFTQDPAAFPRGTAYYPICTFLTPTASDFASIASGVSAVETSVNSLNSLASSVVSAQALDSTVTMTERSVLILLAGCFAFFLGFGMTKGHR